ncbi:hypothetical protein EON65_24355 [archaeon]|nr:MAG: hypothetical protein EON65_24355 [archaeon]
MEALDGEETQFYAAKLQAAARKFIVRSKIMKQITERYEKIFDPKRKKYYYYDKKFDSSSWLKPVLLLDKDIEDVAPTYLPEQAAVKLQRIIRRFLSLLRVRIKFQESIVKVKDEKSNVEYYINSKTGSKLQQLPSFMNGRLDYERKEPRELGPVNSDDESDDNSDAESMDTETRLEKRRKRRKYPR